MQKNEEHGNQVLEEAVAIRTQGMIKGSRQEGRLTAELKAEGTGQQQCEQHIWLDGEGK